jgi:hypothetical protein
MDNAFTGDVELALGDQRLTLRYDWKALAALRTRFGKGFMRKLDEVMMDAAEDPEALADLVVAGLRRNHPEVTVEAIMDQSPPVTEVIAAVSQALAFAFYGPAGPPKADPRLAVVTPKKAS